MRPNLDPDVRFPCLGNRACNCRCAPPRSPDGVTGDSTRQCGRGMNHSNDYRATGPTQKSTLSTDRETDFVCCHCRAKPHSRLRLTLGNVLKHVVPPRRAVLERSTPRPDRAVYLMEPAIAGRFMKNEATPGPDVRDYLLSPRSAFSVVSTHGLDAVESRCPP